MAEKFFGLLGRKLGHSWSPPIHSELGTPTYQLKELEPEYLPAFLSRSDLGGVNVTVPYKRDVLPYCDVIDEEAKAIGSVNTLVRRADGKLYAWNTDVIGFRWMVKRAGIELAEKKVMILGSGGASLTTQHVARTEGAREIVVISRTGTNNYENLHLHSDAEIVINTTPVGMYPHNGLSPVDLALFPRCTGVLDVIYNPQHTALLQQAEQLGIPCSDGLPMLVAQAKAAAEHFYDKPISDSENERILLKLRRDMTNIVLIGMPGCGKTTLGKILSERTGREAIDIDQYIESRAGRSIPELFRQDGEAAFRTLERQITAEIGKQQGKIILTGGGVVKDKSNYAPLHQNGRIYHVIRDLDVLPVDGRPVSQSTALSVLWEERAPLYQAFRDTLVSNNGTAKDAADAIWREFCEYFDHKRT